MFRNLSVQRSEEDRGQQSRNATSRLNDDDDWAHDERNDYLQEDDDLYNHSGSREPPSRTRQPMVRGSRRGANGSRKGGAVPAATRNVRHMSFIGILLRAILWLFVISVIVTFVGRRVSLASSDTGSGAVESYYETAFIACRVSALRGAQWTWRILSHTILGASRFIIPSSILDLTSLSELMTSFLMAETNEAFVSPVTRTQPIVAGGAAFDDLQVGQEPPSDPIHHEASAMPVLPGEYDFFVRRAERLPKASPNELLGAGLYGSPSVASTCLVSSMVHESVSRGTRQYNNRVFQDAQSQPRPPPPGFNALAGVWTVHVHEYGGDDDWSARHSERHRNMMATWLHDESATAHQYMLMVSRTCGQCQWVNHATGARGNLVACDNCNAVFGNRQRDTPPRVSSVIVGIAHVYAAAPMSMKQIVAVAYDEDEVWGNWRGQLHDQYRVIGAGAAFAPNTHHTYASTEPVQQHVSASLVWHSFFTTARNDTQYTKRQWHYLQTAFPLSSPTVAQSIPSVSSTSLLASMLSASVPPYDVPAGISSDLDTIQTFKAIVVSRDRMILGRVRRELVDASSSSGFVSSLWRRMRDQKLSARGGAGMGSGGGLDILESIDVLVSSLLPDDFFDLGVTAVRDGVTEEAWDSPIVPGTDFGEWYEYFLLMTREKMWRAWHRQALHKPLIVTSPPPHARREDNNATVLVSCDYESILNDLVLPSILDMSTVDDAERVDIRRLIRASLASSAAAFSSKGAVPLAVFESSLDASDVNEMSRDFHTDTSEPFSGAEAAFMASSGVLDRDEAMKSLSEICSYDTSADRLSEFHRASTFVSSLMPDIYPLVVEQPVSQGEDSATQQHRAREAHRWQSATPQRVVQSNQRHDASATRAPSTQQATTPTMGRCIALASAMAWYDVIHSDVFLNRHSIAGAVMPQHHHHTMRVERVVRSDALSPASPIYASQAVRGFASSSAAGQQHNTRRSFQRSVSSAACNASPEQNWNQWRVTRDSLHNSLPVKHSEELARRDLSLFVDEWNDNALSSQSLNAQFAPPIAVATHATSATSKVGHHFAPLASAASSTCDYTWTGLSHALQSSVAPSTSSRRVFATSSPICTISPSTVQILQYASHVLSSCYN